MNGLIEFQALASKYRWTVVSVQQFSAKDNGSEVDANRELNVIKNSGAQLVILNAGAENAMGAMAQAFNKGMMGPGWMWVGMDAIVGSVSFQM